MTAYTNLCKKTAQFVQCSGGLFMILYFRWPLLIIIVLLLVYDKVMHTKTQII